MNLEIEKIFNKSRRGNWQDDVYVFWQITKPYTGRLIAAVSCSLVLSGINGGIAWLIKPVLDSIFIKKSETLLLLLPLGIIALFLMRGVFTYLTNYLMGSIGAKAVRSLRGKIYDKLLTLPLSFYGRTSSGSVISRVLNDVEVLQSTLAHTIKDFFVSGGTVIVLSVVAIMRRWDLALLSFVVIPLIIYSVGKLGARMKRISMNTRKLFSKVTTLLHESLQGIKIIKVFIMEEQLAKQYDNTLSDQYRSVMREVRTREFSALLAELLGGIGVAIILFYGGHLVMSEKISTGDFFSFITALLMIYTPLKRLSKVNNDFQQARTIIDRVKEIVSVEPEREGGMVRDIQGHIIFEDASFRYPTNRNYALREINLEIKQGEFIAIVGHSGAGKSTLVDLIAGFWCPTTGRILIDGIDIRELSLKSLRSHIGLVTQDVVLFNDSIKANILLGCQDATEEEVIEAAKVAYAHEFITELPEGYETKIGERGVRLSGGQKQRLTIARAILKSPKILIFDEATSSLDTDSEIKIQKAIERIIPGRTTIVIAHRLSTIRRADRVIVMDKGKIIQQGKHDELLARTGTYRELHNMQFGLIK